MTSTSSETRPFRAADLGTLALLAWVSEAEDGRKLPYLLACSMGDAVGGPETTTAAVERLLRDNGLPVGGEELVDGTARPSLPISMLVVAGQIVLTMPHLNSQCTPPQEWLDAVAARGWAYFAFTTRPCPSSEPGKPVGAQELSAFAGAEETLKSAAHVILPARSLRS